MDSSGRIHMYEDASPSQPPERKVYRDRLVTRFPIPEQCDARKVLSALEKLDGATELPPECPGAFHAYAPRDSSGVAHCSVCGFGFVADGHSLTPRHYRAPSPSPTGPALSSGDAEIDRLGSGEL